jgi:hypothetical protein
MRDLLLLASALLCLVQAGTPAQFHTLDDRYPAPRPVSRSAWEARAAYLREHVLASAGLLPLPERCALRPVVFDESRQADYLVAKVYFESLPGFYVTGNLYRPPGNGPFPAVLSPHGHWTYGRLENSDLVSGPGRAINLARRGFVVFSYDMIGYNDSRQLTHTFSGRRETLWGLSLSGLQLWNSIRSLDYLQSLPFVKKDAIAVTGESGGGTQTFLLAAADTRVAAAVPVNMISLHMQGGCLCENPPGLRLDTNNVEIAATIAPRPLLMISATGDWTAETLEAEYPAVRSIYSLLGAEDHVAAVRMTAEHNYNKDSREAMYAWLERWLKGGPAQARAAETSFTPLALPELLVFHGRPLPDGAASAGMVTSAWIEAARRQLASTALETRAAALRHALEFPVSASDSRRPAAGAARRDRPTVLAAGADPGVLVALRSAGFLVRNVVATPFDEAAAAKVQHFETYNRTLASQRVADIAVALEANPGAVLVAGGAQALPALLASAIAPSRLTVLDAGGFDTSRDDDYLDRLYIPGLRRAGDVATASEMAPGRIVVHGAGASFAAPGARAQQGRLTPAQVVALVRAVKP